MLNVVARLLYAFATRQRNPPEQPDPHLHGGCNSFLTEGSNPLFGNYAVFT
ncbi:TPA: hypothetical protein KYJ64_004590 [Salmonella enterica subsp. enterica serovar Dublin]|nr:hypothetical protein [Salmonella enterica subsp. enterica serovar Dublin]